MRRRICFIKGFILIILDYVSSISHSLVQFLTMVDPKGIVFLLVNLDLAIPRLPLPINLCPKPVMGPCQPSLAVNSLERSFIEFQNPWMSTGRSFQTCWSLYEVRFRDGRQYRRLRWGRTLSVDQVVLLWRHTGGEFIEYCCKEFNELKADLKRYQFNSIQCCLMHK